MAQLQPWQYRSRALRRQEEQQNLQRLQSNVGPLVGAGDPASMARARSLTNIEARAERTAQYKANLQARMRESMGKASDRESMGIRPAPSPKKKKSGGGLLGKLGDVAEDVGGGLKDVAGDVGGELKGGGKQAFTTGMRVLDSPRSRVGAPAFSILTGSLEAERKPILDAQGNPTGRFYRSAPGFKDFGQSLLSAATSNPVDTYRDARQANEERLQDPELNTFTRTLLQGAQDPLSYLGPGIVKQALRVAPKAIRASRGAGVAAKLIEDPLAVSGGAVLGSAAAAQGAENAGLGPTGQGIAAFAGGIAGGGVAGGVRARGVKQALREVDTGLAKVQGRPGQRAALGLGISDTHPSLERYIETLDEHGIEWKFGDDGRVLLADPDDAARAADQLASSAHGEWESRKGEWHGNAFNRAGDGYYTDVQGFSHYGAMPASGSIPKKRGTGSPEANRAMDDAERIWELLDEADVDPAKEQRRAPWEKDTRLPGFEPLPADQLKLLEQNWEELAKGGWSGEVESKRLAARLGQARADAFIAEKLGADYSPAGTSRDLRVEIDAAELFASKKKPLAKGADPVNAKRETMMPLVERSYVERLKAAEAELQARGHGAGGRQGEGPAAIPGVVRGTEIAAPAAAPEAVRNSADIIPTETKYDRKDFNRPEILAARAEQAARPVTAAIDAAEPVRYAGRQMTRGEMREQLVDEFYGEGAKTKGKRVDIVIGLPASGKSKVLVDPIAEANGSKVIDSDFVKEEIPEFDGGKGAGAVHQESSDIADAIVARGFQAGDNLVLPLVGKNPDRIDAIRQQAEQYGYEVHLRFMELDPTEAAARAVERWEREGRFVDPDYVVNKVGMNPRLTYDKLKGRFASFESYSNDVPRGQAPTLLERSGPGAGRRGGGRAAADASAAERGAPGEGARNAAEGLDPAELDRAAGRPIPEDYDYSKNITRHDVAGDSGLPPPPRPPAPGAGGLEPPDDFVPSGRPTRVDLTGTRDEYFLEEPDWLKRQFEESTEAEYNFQQKALEHMEALGADPRDLPFALPDIKVGLTRMDKAGNALKETIGIGVNEDPLATPAMRSRKRLQTQVNAQAARLGALSQRLVSDAFKRDKLGRIVDLPGQPTLPDLAAALPKYQAFLTPEQMGVLRKLREEAEPFKNLMDEANIDLDSRADVKAGGGFYLPRGRAEVEGLDLPSKVPSGRYMGTGTRKGFEKEAVFETQVEGIEAGFEYPDIGETMQSYARDAGRRALDQYTSDYFKSLKTPDGQNIAMSFADRIDAELRAKHQKLVEDIAKTRGRLATAERRAGVAVRQSDELDTALMAFSEAARYSPDIRSMSKEAARQKRQAKRLRRGQVGRKVEVDDKGNVIVHEQAFLEGETIDRVVKAFEDQMPDSLEFADAVDRAIAGTARRLSELEKKGTRWKGEVDALRGQLQRAEGQLRIVQPEYRSAVNAARRSTRGTAQIGFVQLNGRAFPIELANAANKWLQAERPPMGKFAGTTVAIDAFNSLMRGLRATMDASFLGIQGLVTAASDPRAAGTAMKVAYKALAEPTALGAYLRDFDASRVAKGRPTSKDWARVGGHIGGADTEFAIQARGLTALGRKVQNLPGPRQANRMFGYYGDAARLETWDTLAEIQLSKGVELTDDVMTAIAQQGNLATGWSPNTFGGSVGQLAQFAPRFFQSQLELVAKAFAGKGLERSLARKSLLRLMGVAAGMTVLANELSPDGLKPEQYLSPWKDPKNPLAGTNPNFMRFRVAGTDVSLLGPWDSLLKGMQETAFGLANNVPGVESRGSATYLLRSKASPALGMAWDLMSGEDFIGDKTRTPDYFVRSLLPFSLADLGPDTLTRDGAAGLAVGMTGVKATPMSPTENLDRIAQAAHGKDFYDIEPSQQKVIKEEHPDLWQRAVEAGTAQRQRREGLKAELEEKQRASDAQLLSGAQTREEWIAAMKARQDELAYRSKEIYGERGAQKPKDALDRYFVAIEGARDQATDQVDWDQVNDWREAQPEADQDYIDRNTGLNGTPLAQLYTKLSRQYYQLPRYRGYDARQAKDIDALYTAVNNLAKGDSKLAKVSALKKAAAMVGADDDTVKAVRRRIYGLLQETRDREKWRKAHPESALFLGRGQLLEQERTAINGQMRRAA